jgi:UDPglucose 6-dehydrogenase
VLGAAFKPNSDDIRDSPALHVAASLKQQGAEVRVHDPQAIENARAAFPALDFATDVEKVLEGAHLVLHLTEWEEYRTLDPSVLLDFVATPRLLDGRNALDLERWRQAGWTVRAPGRSQTAADQTVIGNPLPSAPSSRDISATLKCPSLQYVDQPTR